MQGTFVIGQQSKQFLMQWNFIFGLKTEINSVAQAKTQIRKGSSKQKKL